MRVLLVLAFCAILFGAVASINFKKCTATAGQLNSITVTGCGKAATCTFKIGTNVTLDATFTSRVASSKAIVKIVGLIGGVLPVPFPIEPEDACGNYGLKCPFAANTQNRVAITMPILEKYPEISVTVKFRLVASNNANLLCVEFPVEITK
ncbi:epididymal secretory protein E1-like protein [Dinothrombium tinctorium]|uniref:Epididymal secretory protein E1-like protein n=1 Tax=Dinothrombium tinctorium TaxID=1965070 RepID=A0A3S3RLD3_9ACAR|nr:epididymal secretory protein E1-like protein [Dinothrombium tinctorium]